MALKRERLALYATILLALVAVWMRLHQLAMPYERDFDEGVYWESLRLMDAGHPLYFSIYYSQPPLFLLTAFPFFEAFGRSIGAARASCAILSLAGIAGAYLCGRAAGGVRAAVVAMALATASAAYLQASQTLEAEASSVGLSWLSVGLALVSSGMSVRRRAIVAAFAGATFAVALLCKFLAVAAIVPIAISFLPMRIRGAESDVRTSLIAAGAWSASAAAVCLAVAATFWYAHANALVQVVGLHAGPSVGIGSAFRENLPVLGSAFVTPIGVAALAGTIAAAFQRRRVAVVFAAWAFAVVAMLSLLTPLFAHHTVALIPPAVALACMVLSAPRAQSAHSPRAVRVVGMGTVAACGLLGILGCATYFTRDARLQALPDTLVKEDAVSAVAADIPLGCEIITDDDFVVALAGRDTPPDLVDTSFARIRANQLDGRSVLRTAVSDPNIRGVLLFTNRLAKLGIAHMLAPKFEPVTNFGSGRELWAAPHSKPCARPAPLPANVETPRSLRT